MTSSEEMPATWLRVVRPPERPETIVLIIERAIGPADLPDLCEEARAALVGGEAREVECVLGPFVEADAAAVDALARLHLTARRCGLEARLHDPCEAVHDLVEFMGLGSALTPGRGSGIERWRQSEERKHGRGVQEERDPDDLPGR